MENLVTIITVHKGNFKCLYKTLNSVKNLSNKFVHIVQVNGDQNEYNKFVELFPKVQFFFSNDCGPFDAMNKAANHAQSTWLWFLNSGDLSQINRSTEKVLIESCNNHQYDFIIGHTIYQKHANQRRINATDFSLGRKLNFSHPSTFIRTKHFILLNGFNNNYRYCSDLDFFMRSKDSTAKCLIIPFDITLMERVGISTKLRYFPIRFFEHFKIVSKNIGISSAILHSVYMLFRVFPGMCYRKVFV